MNEVITYAQNASCFEQVVSGLLFFGFVYYFMYIPITDKTVERNPFVRVWTDLKNLYNKHFG